MLFVDGNIDQTMPTIPENASVNNQARSALESSKNWVTWSFYSIGSFFGGVRASGIFIISIQFPSFIL